MTSNLPSISLKQIEILTLLYRFRFLDRTHIQAFLKHKDRKRILSWLKDLREKQYVNWQYDATDFAAKTKPAIYYLNLNGIRYLRSLNEYPSKELRKRYKESTRSQGFIDRCLLIADCCATLLAQNSTDIFYEIITAADYADQDINGSLDRLNPHLFFIKQQNKLETGYLFEIFDIHLPRYQFRKRLNDYANYLVYEDWNDSLNEVPIILFVCMNTADLLYLERRMLKVLEDEDIEDYIIRLTTVERLKTTGITGAIWEEI